MSNRNSDVQIETADEFEIRHQDVSCTNESKLVHPWWYNLKYTLVGILFGIVFVKAEIISWFRIQEMFQLTSFFMYGVIGTAVVVGALSVFIIKKMKLKSIYGEEISIDDKKFNKGQIYGAAIFGIGWAITGACPGPLFAQVGSGFSVVIVTILSAIAGTWIYGKFREKLPH
ncbi:MAG TPA: YeeE/YedE thiosulfate transporter family protein [Ignavibacteria bacterium]|nr:YeeE/YedE thiosulfate transporter family protein [Ignavibacteria bacterium]HRB01193.1 YeeE/YedE thiosulfate transporter family protein [Ignavibacteria bacterium]